MKSASVDTMEISTSYNQLFNFLPQLALTEFSWVSQARFADTFQNKRNVPLNFRFVLNPHIEMIGATVSFVYQWGHDWLVKSA